MFDINVFNLFCLALSYLAQAKTKAGQENENEKRCQLYSLLNNKQLFNFSPFGSTRTPVHWSTSCIYQIPIRLMYDLNCKNNRKGAGGRAFCS